MKDHSQKRYLFSKSGVKVYLRPEYHPLLKRTNLFHPDFIRKARELYAKRYGTVARLPRICSENSEDIRTWYHFSPLLSMPSNKKGDWLANFMEMALGSIPNEELLGMLPIADLLFWRGRKKAPMYPPPPNLSCAEGNTEVDLTITVPDKAIIFIEAKYLSDIQFRTTYCPKRDQIIRNIDVGTYFAWNRGLDFYFVLLASSNCVKSIERLNYYKQEPQNILSWLPHRSDIKNRLEHIIKRLGFITWDQLRAREKKKRIEKS